ncbi:hypothetical protein HELRODRAFT_187038 [Helobdella robusta]|uniref:Alpha-actinin n=1 Tax=Helobdella robusta TaxID=6412 RepID=T1FP58_HELRO|nr:hypothetical protein HELRODRAFT_187038 [Helobdella robusta]ESO04015.1 hypothetical protein HELRODRAFT_187038 [Helobdella robusta]
MSSQQQQPEHSREQEDEWEREAVLDPLWEKQQKKTFTAWCNSHLRKAKTSIENIEEDFKDGLKLMLLLEVISGEQLGKPDKGKMRFHKIANVNKALHFIMSKGVKLVSIGAEEIVDGNLKMTLGMIWTIILRFAIQDISVEEMTAKEGLLLWCKRKTSPYKNVNVQNFHMSFKDGLAFCALIHRHRPDLIDYNKLSKDNPLANLNLAFDVAEKHLDIPRMLDAEGLPDERSVMAYVSSYYHAFSGAQQAETAANRIMKVLKANRDNENLMEEYERLASDLLKWIKATKPWLEDRTPSKSISAARENVERFRDYRADKKPEKLKEKAKLETSFSSLQTRLRLSNRPPYLPSEGKLIGDINTAWTGLENAEKGYEEWLLQELQRLEKLDYLAKKFRHKCELHDAWSAGKMDQLQPENLFQYRLDEIKAKQKRHEALENDLMAHEERMKEINDIATELAILGYHDMASINSRHQQVQCEWNQLQNQAKTKKTSLQEVETELERIDQLYLDFAKKSSIFGNWLASTSDDLQDLFQVHSVNEIQLLIEAHESFKKSLPDADQECQNIVSTEKQIKNLCEKHAVVFCSINPYSPVNAQIITERWRALMQLVPERDRKLQEELTRQMHNEDLRKKFAAKANVVGQWIDQHYDYIGNVVGSKGTLEDHLAKLKSLDKEVIDYTKNITELQLYSKSLQEALIFDNSYSSYTMETLNVKWEQLQTSLSWNINELENQILTRDSKGISSQQLEEYRKSFQHFDKSKNRKLDANEFRACLISIGYKLLDNKQGDTEFQKIMSEVDPNRLGYVTFDAFLDFMSKESLDVETSEQLIQSFKILANDKPYLTEETLRHELIPEYADYCIARMSRYTGKDAPANALDYTTFANLMYGESDL